MSLRRKSNRRKAGFIGSRRIFRLHLAANRNRSIWRSGIRLISHWCGSRKENRFVRITRTRPNRNFIWSSPAEAVCVTKIERRKLDRAMRFCFSPVKRISSQTLGGKYAVSFKGISEALGREPASLDLCKRHPFDLEWNRVPPGKYSFPYHAHSAQWELYLVISGSGNVRHKDGTTKVAPGDAF